MIELRGVSFSYNSGEFIKNLNLTLRDACLTVIIGENGSGKSTLLSLLCALKKPKSGCILLDGEDICVIPPTERAKRLSYFPQSRPIPDMYVTEAVLMGRYPHNRGRLKLPVCELQRAQDAMLAAGAAKLADRRMASLSYGERQKVYLAMLIAQDAAHCIFDEPANFLDISAKFAMMDMLAALRDEGRCVVCVLHDISLAMSYVDRIIIMKNGNLFADGTPAELYGSGSIDAAFGIGLKRIDCGGSEVYTLLPKKG